MKKLFDFIRKDVVLEAAWILAIVSVFFVKPDKEYLQYVDWRTLAILYCLMLIIAGLRVEGVFQKSGAALLKETKTTRGLETVLVLLCFFGSMFITNDVSLMTFVPFSIEILQMAKHEKRILFVVVMQTIAANLGSMLLPTGNPHNLYLYGKANMKMLSFVKVTAPFVVLNLILCLVFVLFRKKESIEVVLEKTAPLCKKKVVVYAVLFLLTAAVVARIAPVYLLAPVLVVLFVMDRSLFKKADYSLLLIFIGFFIFVGNIQRVSLVSSILGKLMHEHELMTSILASQVISNVPAAILLSAFTQNWETLIIGVNVGGLGTLIASMASLISYRLIVRYDEKIKNHYMLLFTELNILFLVINILFSFFLCM